MGAGAAAAARGRTSPCRVSPAAPADPVPVHPPRMARARCDRSAVVSRSVLRAVAAVVVVLASEPLRHAVLRAVAAVLVVLEAAKLADSVGLPPRALTAAQVAERADDVLDKAAAATLRADLERVLEAAGAVDETVSLLHLPPPLVGVSIVMERERQQNDRTLADG